MKTIFTEDAAQASYERGLAVGHEQGRAEGFAEGHDAGYARGYAHGRADDEASVLAEGA